MINNFKSRSISALILLPFSLFFIFIGGYSFIFFLIICMFISLIEWNNMVKKKIIKLLGFIFIIFSFFSTYKIRSDPGNEQTLIFFLLILFTCIFTDTGGYLFGNIFKGPKLTKISPNKTYAGVVGAFVCPLFFIYIFLSISNFSYKVGLIYDLQLVYYILFFSLIGQIGDLIISYFKRLAKIKDTGGLIPGHGGILDRIDGMLFVYPVFFIFNLLFK